MEELSTEAEGILRERLRVAEQERLTALHKLSFPVPVGQTPGLDENGHLISQPRQIGDGRGPNPAMGSPWIADMSESGKMMNEKAKRK